MSDAASRRPRPLISVAPMIDVTDRHFRMFIRCISPMPVLYTEMTWDRAILFNAPGEPEHALNKNPPLDVQSIIGYSPAEQPLVMQLGGAEPVNLARAAKYCVAAGYDEINLNCGCPAQVRGRSKNSYGARLMFEPERVRDCCAAMIAAVGDLAEITVKCRLGVDKKDSYEELTHFIRTVSSAGVTHFIVHARKALLGLSTIQNRHVPPLRHEWVFRLVDEFPHLRFTLNGGVSSVDEVHMLLQRGNVHGVMLGRRANADPYLFARCGMLCSGTAGPSRREVLEKYMAYACEAQSANWEGLPAERLARCLLTPLTGLFHNTPYGPRWRRLVTHLMHDKHAVLTSRPFADGVHELIAEIGAPAELLDARPSLQLQALPSDGERMQEGWLKARKAAEERAEHGEGARGTSSEGGATAPPAACDGATGAPAGEAATGARASAEDGAGGEEWMDKGIDVDRSKTAMGTAFVASRGSDTGAAANAGANGAGRRDDGCGGRKRSGKGQEEMEAVLEAEAAAEDEAAALQQRRRVVLLGVGLVVAVAAGSLAMASRRPVR